MNHPFFRVQREASNLPSWRVNNDLNPIFKQKEIYVRGQPIIQQFAPYNKFVDNFRFPAPEKAQRLPLPEADFSIDKNLYRRSNNPKSLYITNQGTYATKKEGEYLPSLNTDSLGGWAGRVRGDLERVQYERQPLRYLGSREDYNDWRNLS